MDDRTRDRVTQDVLDLVQSFQEAIHDAGGIITIKSLRSMTINQLFSILAPNKVHFFYSEKTKKSEENTND